MKKPEGESSEVFQCEGVFNNLEVSVYIKVNKNPGLSPANEAELLSRLSSTTIPVPKILWYGKERHELIILEELKGHMIWDYIDPSRALYDKSKVLSYLHSYGK